MVTVSLVSNKMGGGDAGSRKDNDRPMKLGIKQKVTYQTNVVMEAVT